jgi:hypothetical protein
VRHVRILAERDQLTAGDLEHRPASDALPDARAIADRERLHFRVGAGDDDARGILRSSRDAVGQIARETRAARTRLRGHSEGTEDGNGKGQREASTCRQGSTQNIDHGYPQKQPVVKLEERLS